MEEMTKLLKIVARKPQDLPQIETRAKKVTRDEIIALFPELRSNA